jgi:hypothetical protein
MPSPTPQCDEPRGCISAGRPCSERDDTPNRAAIGGAARVPNKEPVTRDRTRGSDHLDKLLDVLSENHKIERRTD